MPGILSTKSTNRKKSIKNDLPSTIGFRANMRKHICKCGPKYSVTLTAVMLTV